MLRLMSDEPQWHLYRLDGIMTTSELRAAGSSGRMIRARVLRGELVRLGMGLYARPDFAEALRRHEFGDYFLAAYAAVAGFGDGPVVSHRTAAHLHGLDLLAGPGADVTLTRAPGRGSRSAKPGVHLHVARLPPDHVCYVFGLPITTVARTVVDLTRATTFRDGLVTADSALHLHRTTKKELQAVMTDLQRVRGCRRAADVVEFADGLAESALESIARAAFRDCGLPRPALQVRIGGDKFIGRVDFLWDRYRTIAEVDGALKYADPYRARAQLRRDKQLREAGYEVVHFDWREITCEPDAVAASIRAAFMRGSQRGLGSVG
jgi:very-short-patch-repair endonuclease/predicted transcriptional regulator of viral defense system